MSYLTFDYDIETFQNEQLYAGMQILNVPDRMTIPGASAPNYQYSPPHHIPLEVNPAEARFAEETDPSPCPFKILRRIQRQDPSDDIHFNTPVDKTLKALETGAFAFSTTAASFPHTKRTNAGEFRCDNPKCNETFTFKSQLQAHKLTHSGEKPLECPYCHVAMSQRSNLKTHIKRHLGMKEFRCQHCFAGFTAKSGLTAHTKSKHSRSTKIPCLFDDCQKSFSTRGNLKLHLNNLHPDEMEDLVLRVDRSSISDRERQMLVSIEQIFQNSNKGVKGRGKEAYVARLGTPFDLPTL